MDGALFWAISITVGFVSGVVALFAPCCLTVLLPAYLAQIVQTRVRVVMATLVFALGIATVMLPIALGFRALVTVFNQYHTAFYGTGGLLMVLIGLLLIGQFKLPMWVTPRQLQGRVTLGSLYFLGVTSGLATACCAPVLLGAIAVTSLSPTLLLAFLVGVSYVLGMVLPLLAGGMAMNANGLMKLRQIFTRPIATGTLLSVRFPDTIGKTTLGSLIGGITMIGYGLFLFLAAVTGRLTALQEADGFSRTASLIGRNTSKYLNENPIMAALALIILIVLIWAVTKKLRTELKFRKEENE